MVADVMRWRGRGSGGWEEVKAVMAAEAERPLGCARSLGWAGLTDLSVQNLLLAIAQWFNDLEDGMKESEVAQPPGLVVELLPLRLLSDSHKDVARLLLDQWASRGEGQRCELKGWKVGSKVESQDLPAASGTKGISWPR